MAPTESGSQLPLAPTESGSQLRVLPPSYSKVVLFLQSEMLDPCLRNNP
jgi:hypothetical protein